MTQYKEFSLVYDLFMDGDHYELWARHIEKIFKTYAKAQPKLVLDMACGTGNITRLLAKKGYDMIGLDISEDMLMVAREKNSDILFLNQDMTEMDLFGTVDAAVCFCDGINYLLSDKEVLKTFRCVNNYLNPKGIFVFDLNTDYKYKNILGINTFAVAKDEAAYIWENFYDEKERVNEYDVTFFIKEGNLYRRFSEEHIQKAHSREAIERLIREADMKLLGVFDADTLKEPRQDSARLIFAATTLKENEEN